MEIDLEVTLASLHLGSSNLLYFPLSCQINQGLSFSSPPSSSLLSRSIQLGFCGVC